MLRFRRSLCCACAAVALFAIACGQTEPLCTTDFALPQGGGLRSCVTRGGDEQLQHRVGAVACREPDTDAGRPDGGCLKESDCKKGQACYCYDGAYGQCVPAGCHADGDCDDSRCYVSRDACGANGLYCATSHDHCQAGSPGCVYDDGRWNDNGADSCP